MRFYNCDLSILNKAAGEKNIVCFGVSKNISYMISRGEAHWLERVKYFVDNNSAIQGSEIAFGDKIFKVYSPDILQEDKDIIILITAVKYEAVKEIIDQISGMQIDSSISCYSIYMMKYFGKKLYDNTSVNLGISSQCKIEKKIHCCWFSGDPKPEEYLRCIDSWKKWCPDYEILEWNSHNYDVGKNNYMKRAYELRAWAFASDYARLDLVYNYGGIYLDMDVELLKPLNDFLGFDAFFSFQKEDECVDLGSGFGAKARFPLIKELLDEYEGMEFCKGDDKFSSKTVLAQPEMLYHIFERNGYAKKSASQVIGNVVYLSPDYIRTINDRTHDGSCLTGNEYAVHWHHAGWYDKEEIEKRERELAFAKNLLKYGWETVDNIL